MPSKESLQHKLDRVRPPRVQITYDVEVGGAIELKELPFVIGVMGDFVGKPEEPLPALKNRKFVEIDADNFNQVLSGMKPRLAYSVENKLQDDGSKLGVDITSTTSKILNRIISSDKSNRFANSLKRVKNLPIYVQKWTVTKNWKICLNDIIADAGKQKELSDALGLESDGAKEE